MTDLIGYIILLANQNASILVKFRNKLWNFEINFPNLHANIRSQFSNAN